jgi:hypothetical protein
LLADLVDILAVIEKRLDMLKKPVFVYSHDKPACTLICSRAWRCSLSDTWM